jgi:hypothetical protein
MNVWKTMVSLEAEFCTGSKYAIGLPLGPQIRIVGLRFKPGKAHKGQKWAKKTVFTVFLMYRTNRNYLKGDRSNFFSFFGDAVLLRRVSANSVTLTPTD